MKNRHFFYVLVACLLASCVSQPVKIGHVNMILNRNISGQTKYEILQKFAGSTRRQQMRSRAGSINDAIDAVVRSVPGGEYLMNAKLYRVGCYFAAEGDVWGLPGQTDVNGLKPNGIAFMRRAGRLEKVRIVSFADNDRVSVELQTGKIILINRDWLVVGEVPGGKERIEGTRLFLVSQGKIDAEINVSI